MLKQVDEDITQIILLSLHKDILLNCHTRSKSRFVILHEEFFILNNQTTMNF